MAGLDYGLLKPIEGQTRVVGSGTNSSPGVGDSLDSLAGGIVQGMKTASDIATAKQNRDEAAAAFPSQLQELKNQTEESNLKLAGEKADAQDAADLRAASLKGTDAYRSLLYQQDPAKGQAYDLQTIKTKQGVSDIANKDALTDKQTSANYDSAINQLSQINRAAAAGKTPQLQQQIYQFGLSQLPKTMQNNIVQTFGSQFNLDTSMAVNRLATENQADKTIKSMQDSKATPLQQNVFIHDQISKRIAQAQQNGQQPDPVDVKNEQIFKQAIMNDATVSGKGKTDKPVPNPLLNAIGTQDAKEMQAADDLKTPLKTMSTDVRSVENVLEKIPHGFTGKLVDLTKLNINNSDIQVLQHHFASMGYLAKTIMANQSAGMRLTASELTQLNKIVGGTDVNWDSIKTIMSDMKGKLQEKTHDAWSTSNRVRSSAATDDAGKASYNNWKIQNPEPIDPAKSAQMSPYTHNGKPVPYDALHRARWDNPDLSEEDVVKKFGLIKASK